MRLRKFQNKHFTSWIIDYKDQYGSRKRRVLKGIHTKRYAQIAFADFVLRYERGLVGLPTDENISLGDALDNRIKDRQLACCSSSWIYNLRLFRKRLTDYYGEVTFFMHLDDTAINQYKYDRLQQGARAETIKKEMAFIGSAGRLALRQGKIGKLPWTKIEMPVDRSGKQTWHYLSLNEIERLLDFLKNGKEVSGMRSNTRMFSCTLKPSFKTYATVVVLLNTGMRRGECFRLTWQDIDEENRVIRVVGTKTAKNGQNARIRYVPMNKALVDLFAGMTKGNPDEPVYGDDINFRRKFKKALKYAGLPNVRVHDLRHTYASHLVMNGTPIYSVAQLLGHSTIEMSSRYSHLDMSHLHHAVSKLQFEQNDSTPETVSK